MNEIDSVTFSDSKLFGCTLSLRQVGARFEVVRRGHKKGSRDCVLSRHASEEAGREAFARTVAVADYWSKSISAGYAARIEAGKFTTVEV